MSFIQKMVKQSISCIFLQVQRHFRSLTQNCEDSRLIYLKLKYILDVQHFSQLPKGFADRLLLNDISLVMSEYTNKDALHQLVQLYMVIHFIDNLKQGVEIYESLNDSKHEYFRIKLLCLMNHPKVQAKQNQVSEFDTSECRSRNSVGSISSQNRSNDQISRINFTKLNFQVDQSKSFHFDLQNEKIQPKTKILLSDEVQLQKSEKKESEDISPTKKQKENLHQQLKQEILTQDEWLEAKNMVEVSKIEKQNIDKVCDINNNCYQIIKEDFENQTKNLNNRLILRNQASKNYERSSSLPQVKLDFYFQSEKKIENFQQNFIIKEQQRNTRQTVPIKEELYENSK